MDGPLGHYARGNKSDAKGKYPMISLTYGTLKKTLQKQNQTNRNNQAHEYQQQTRDGNVQNG